MSVLRRSADRGWPSVWRAAGCAALAVLFLYNPFLGALGQHANFTVCHPASHRATTGASELEQFSQPGGVAVPLPDVGSARVLLLVPAAADEAPYDVVREKGAPPQTGFSLSLWFRPPPTV